MDCISFFLLEFLPFLFVDSAISQTSIRRSSLGFSCRLHDSSSDVSIERLTVCKIRPFLKSLSVFVSALLLSFFPFISWFLLDFRICGGVFFFFLGRFFNQILRVFFLEI